jgi:hypothetical protein
VGRAGWLLTLVCLNVPALTSADDAFLSVVAPFLQRHCTACHGATKQEAQVRLDQLEGFQTGDRELWTLVHEKIAAGQMPPAPRPRPDEAETRQVLAWIAQQQRLTGAGSIRRLNRRELSAMLQDLTGLPIDYAHALPGDGRVAGFDTGAEGLQDAADSVARWMEVSRRAVDAIRFLEPPRGRLFAATPREFDFKDARKLFDAWKADGAVVKGQFLGRPGLGLLLPARAVGERDALVFAVPAPRGGQGVLRLKLTVSAMKPLGGVPNPHLWVEVSGRDIDYVEITGTLDEPQELVYLVQLDDLAVEAGLIQISLSNKVEIPYAVDGFANEDRSNPDDMIPGGGGLFRPAFDRKQLPPEQQPIPFVVLQQLEIEPDHVAPWPPPQWDAGPPARDDSPAEAERLLRLWTQRAWRRPVSEQQLAPYLELLRALRSEGLSLDDALRAVLQSVLLSAEFRYVASPALPDETAAQYALASRLSFMLWGGPPDAELLRLAAAGRLRDGTVLDAQVDRLLADPRCRGFVEPFVVQWLEMDQPITIAMTHLQKQDFRFARYLKASMREETIAYFTQMLLDNAPARELLASDWTMMNNALAIHYGYPPLPDGKLRRVTLRADDPRGGGILGHAGIQSMLTWMGDNWVIYRGAWTLRHILDQPPPPPPLEVPELNASDERNRGKTFRQLLQQHQQDPRCAVCHKTIDPLGFAFQNFDISGRWRDVEHERYERSELDGKIAWVGVGRTRAVDAAGRLPRGEEFRDWPHFRQLLVAHYQKDLVRGLLKKLVLYGTGRTPDVDDLQDIAAIMQANEARGYPLRDLLKAVVRSRAFLER